MTEEEESLDTIAAEEPVPDRLDALTAMRLSARCAYIDGQRCLLFLRAWDGKQDAANTVLIHNFLRIFGVVADRTMDCIQELDLAIIRELEERSQARREKDEDGEA